jgi:hypothetical protein
MKKIKLFLVALLATTLVSVNAEAQDVKGKRFLNAGIGLGTFGFSGTGGLPITASFEHGFTDKISAGGTVGLVRTKFLTDYHYSYYIVGARGSYHFNELLKVENEKVDLYGGVSLFYRGYKLKYKGTTEEGDYKASAGGLDYALHAGARYMFSDNIGGYAELGYGISPLQLGVALKF